MNKINVAVIGMRFGREFVKIYQKHPNVGKVGICRRNIHELEKDAEEFGIEKRFQFRNINEVLASKDIDAVHIATPIQDHYKHSVMSMRAGKHTACAVPAAASMKELYDLVKTAKESKKIYMMLEPAIFTRDFFYIKNLAEMGALGSIQFMRGYYIKDMRYNKRAEYWLKTAHLMYSTHALTPLLILASGFAEKVTGFGSGFLENYNVEEFGSPFALETMNVKIENSNATAQVICSLYGAVRQYKEGYDIIGSKKSYEWKQLSNGQGVIFNVDETADFIEAPNTDKYLIDELKEFTVKSINSDKVTYPAPTGNRHGGSFPHLVQAFITAIIENKQPVLNARMAANITAAGILGHKSCVKGGNSIIIPKF